MSARHSHVSHVQACVAISAAAIVATAAHPTVAGHARGMPHQPPTAQPASVVVPGATPTRVATGFQFTEGPAADRQGNVYFTDVRGSRIHRWSLDGQVSIYRENSNGANGLYFDLAERLVICEGATRRVTRDDLNGNVSTLVDSFDDKRLNSPNDLWIHPNGGIYFTDPRYGNQAGVEQDGMHVYYLPPDGGALQRVTEDLVTPNGVIGTTDGRTVYVADAGATTIWKYAFEADGSLSGKTRFSPRGADGMALDERGNVYLATGPNIWVVAPDGTDLEPIGFPEAPSNVAFGGADRTTLFVTARTSLYSLAMAVRGADTVWDYPTAVETPGPPETPGTPETQVPTVTATAEVFETPGTEVPPTASMTPAEEQGRLLVPFASRR